MTFLKVYLRFAIFTVMIAYSKTQNPFLTMKSFECGPYGFICEPNNKLRLCEANNIFGPSFRCPADTVCNEDSTDVCENIINYINPSSYTKSLRCHRNERIADPGVPDCKGYILCIPNKNRFQGIKFKCSGNTIFNGYTRACSSPDKYRCPLTDTSKPPPELFIEDNRRMDTGVDIRYTDVNRKPRPIECKNYKLRVTEDKSPVKAAYFCPPRPVQGDRATRCTVFSNKFCLTLEKDDEDQFAPNFGPPGRKPREFQP